MWPAPSSTLGRDAPSTGPSRPKRGLAGQVNAWRERHNAASKAASRPAAQTAPSAQRDDTEMTLKVASGVSQGQVKKQDAQTASDNQAPVPSAPASLAPALDHKAVEDDTTSASTSAPSEDDEA
ncbi:hypothetical protein ATCC90586_006942 [Pythium insidiosum]|nr:hypothetical protein ATCC90586_006942 [Pythium insidiosum]